MTAAAADRRSPLAAARRRVMIAGLTPAALVAALALFRPAVLDRIEYDVYDGLVRGTPRLQPDRRVAIVDVDETSLSALGQWPWRRDLVGLLIDRTRALGAAVVALDIVFPEPDRFHQIVGAAASGEDGPPAPTPSDAALAEALRGGRVVLGHALTFEREAAGRNPCVLHPLRLALLERRPDAALPVFEATGAVCSLPAIARAAGRSGFLNAAPDQDGILRRVPLLVAFAGEVYPSLGLAAFIEATRVRSITLRTEHANGSELVLDDRIVPLDGRGNLLLRYRGGRRAFEYLSAADIIHGRLPADALRDRIVFVGTTALGTRDVVSTPLDTLFPGVEIHATLADNLLRRDHVWRHRDAQAFEPLLVLFLGLTATVVVARAGLAWGAAVAVLAMLAVWMGAAQTLAASGAYWSPFLPVLGLTTAMASMTVARFTAERGRADRAGRQRADTERLMIQTLLSLTEVRDAETGRHSLRTQHYARELATALAADPAFRGYLTPDRIDRLSSLAPLHDIGKVGVPDAILNKPGPLTREELAEMQKHPAYGRDVIANAERRVGVRDDAILQLAKEIVYTHHERWDGTGYPEGLAGTAIPVAGRIMAIVDVYDAAVTRSLYRPPMTHEQVVALIAAKRGTHFDPAIVDAFLRVAPAFKAFSGDADA